MRWIEYKRQKNTQSNVPICYFTDQTFILMTTFSLGKNRSILCLEHPLILGKKNRELLNSLNRHPTKIEDKGVVTGS